MSAGGPLNKSTKNAAKSTSQQNGTGVLYPDTDPELHHDVDIHFPRQPRPSATTRSTVSSGRSRKSKKSDTNRPPIDPANVVLSRGRPMKPHETEPFLTIDNLPAEKTFISEKSTLSGYGTPRHAPNKGQPAPAKSPVMAQLQRMSVYMTPYSREAPGGPSPSVVSGKMSPYKIPKSPTQMAAKPRPLSGSRPNSGTQKENSDDTKGNRQPVTVTEAVPAKILKPNIDSKPLIEKKENEKTMKENGPRPTSGTGIKNDSRPSTGSHSGSRPGTGTRFGRTGSGGRQRGMRSIPSRTGRVTPANTPFQSPSKQLHAPNHQLKSPFKHHISKPDLGTNGRNSPSMGLKERTALAAYHINKMITVAGEKNATKVKGRLQKGKLKPLYPVSVEGPSINNCRGIISDTRSYESSPSRTLQRRLHLMNTIPNVHEYLYDRPRTVESVHRTSIASSIDDNLDYEENDMLPDEILYPAPPAKVASILEPRTPENTFLPINEPEDYQEERQNEKSQVVFATEISAQATDDVNISTQLQQACNVTGDGQQNNPLDQNNSNNVNGELKESSTEHLDDKRLGSAQLRAISSSKSVRFADDGGNNTKELKQITNTNIVNQQRAQEELKASGNNSNTNDLRQSESKTNDVEAVNEANIRNDTTDKDNSEEVLVAKKNKKNSSSCKSDDLNEVRKSDKDSDDEGEGDVDKKGERRDNGNGNDNATNSGQSDSSKPDDKQVDKEGNNKENIEASNVDVLYDKASYSTKVSRDCKASGGRVKNIRPSSANKRSRQSRSAGSSRPSSSRRSASSDRLHRSTKGESCSKFDRSPASKAHTHKLEVSSVIHGSSVHVGLRPESPKRSPSRSSSPSRHNQLFTRSSHLTNYSGQDGWFGDYSYGHHGNHNDLYDPSTNRSKVKFMLEDEEPEIETMFVEDEEDVRLKQDTQISFDTLEAEIMALRMNIHDGMNQIVQDNDELEELDEETGSESEETVVESEDSYVTTETNQGETIDDDYMDILEKYRQQCMNRSEKIGAISTLLVTPRDAGSVMSSSKNSNIDNRGSNSWHMDCDSINDEENQPKYRVLSNMVSSDSGRGSVENLSEFSHSASNSAYEVPKLDLGGSTSDLEIDTGRSEMTLTSGKNGESDREGRNLLEMVCDQLSAKVQKQEKVKRKDEIPSRIMKEEDVTKLKVVATTKSLSKSKRPSLNLSTNKAPYPPLCFTINARPPAGYLYYFAYGPDMNPDRFKNYIMREDVSRYWGLLFGFNLIFNKRGTSEEAGGFSNIEFNPLRSVEGCVYKITPQELQVLDKCIGYPEHYQHLMLPVWMSNSSDPDNLGVAQYCIPALMYIAQNTWTETERTLDHDYSLSQCIKSADLVTKEYKDNLIAMTTQSQGHAMEMAA